MGGPSTERGFQRYNPIWLCPGMLRLLNLDQTVSKNNKHLFFPVARGHSSGVQQPPGSHSEPDGLLRGFGGTHEAALRGTSGEEGGGCGVRFSMCFFMHRSLQRQKDSTTTPRSWLQPNWKYKGGRQTAYETRGGLLQRSGEYNRNTVPGRKWLNGADESPRRFLVGDVRQAVNGRPLARPPWPSPMVFTS